MAKSIRSKWKRKCRAVKRIRYGEKELERLKKTVINDPHKKTVDVDMSDISNIVTVIDSAAVKEKSKKVNKSNKNTSNDDVKMDVNVSGRIFNSRTMRDQNGTYPVWLHPRKISKGKKKGNRKNKKKIKLA